MKEFELIEDDLVTLRDLQVENKELKNKLTDEEEIEESEKISEIEEDDDELTIVRGEEEQEEEDEITIVTGEAEELDEISRISEQQSEGDKREVKLSDKQKSFGSVKVKDGNLFGRWDDSKGTKINSSSGEEESEAAADVGVDSSGVDDNVKIENIEQEIDQESQVGSSIEDEENKSNETQVVAGDLETENNDNVVVSDSQDSDDDVESSREDNVVELNASDEGSKDKKEEASASDSQNDKSAEELLDEFEKMLG